MWNMLVVEDESIVRIGLRYLVDWESYGVVWKAEASNGEEAWNIIEEEEIHIVMTDIRMPVMDGIQLTKKIKERGGGTQVIVISSYDDFPYVQEALRLGVTDYLHKPTMAKEEIVDMLKKVLDNLERTYGPSLTPAGTTEKERDEFLKALLSGTDEEGRLEKQYGALGLPALADGVRLVGIRPASGGREEEQEKSGSRFAAARYFIEKYVSHDWGGAVANGERDELLWLAPAQARSGERTWNEYLAELKKNLANLLNVALVFSGGALASDVPGLRTAYGELQRELGEAEGAVGQAVRMAMDYVDHHFCEDVSLSSCAEFAHVSPAHLSRIFLKETGVNFSDYVIRKKMERAKELLRRTNLRIYEVAEKVGYAHSHYFSKLFKEIVGQSPIEYRNGS
ncbi:response regulator transcription factor [Cohnella phaseoli]|uniref:Two-component system response regulator YesN n=1 Tax=Cohnella phaseoli TaxID=456490 RepID=A0A3D9I187_9BACL|nr:response regulator [Cohnella phaseoli]RED55425.1 two-component system response regulator YesN [Cohnella phaseoli]